MFRMYSATSLTCAVQEACFDVDFYTAHNKDIAQLDRQVCITTPLSLRCTT